MNNFHKVVEEVYDAYTSAPSVAGNFFTCTMGMKVTIKGGRRQKFDEVAVVK